MWDVNYTYQIKKSECLQRCSLTMWDVNFAKLIEDGLYYWEVVL